MLVSGKLVGLVDEEDTVQGGLDALLHVGLGVALVAAHQVLALDLHHMTARQQAEGAEDLAHEARHRGLARARIAAEDIVTGGEGHLAAPLLEGQGIGQFADSGLDRDQADQAIQPDQDPIDVGGALAADGIVPVGGVEAGSAGEILRLDGEQTGVACGDAEVPVQTGRLRRQDLPLEQIAHRAGIAETRLAVGVEEGQQAQQLLGGRRAEPHPVFRQHGAGDLVQLGGRIVVEPDRLATRFQTGVRDQQLLELGRIAGKDDTQLLAAVFHLGHQHAQGALALAMAGGHQLVGLVDEQDPLPGAAQGLGHVPFGIPHMLADELMGGDFMQLALVQQTELMQHGGHDPRHRGLAGTWVSGEQVMAGGLAGQAADAPLGQVQVAAERRELLAHTAEPDQAVQGPQQFIDAGQGL